MRTRSMKNSLTPSLAVAMLATTLLKAPMALYLMPAAPNTTRLESYNCWELVFTEYQSSGGKQHYVMNGNSKLANAETWL